jgi:heterodisulfide reductase subunit A
MYRRARMQGVHFIKGIPSEIVEEEDGSLTLIGENILLGEIYQHNFDMVVLSVGLKSREGSEDIGRLFNLSQDIEGFFIEKHPKLEPVDTAITGVFLAGACESPKDIRESSIQAKAAASRASRLMKEGVIKVEALFGRVSEERCAQCHICEPICPFGAISLDGVAKVSEASCQGCGTCAPSCPSSAITMQHFTDEGVLAQIEAALEEGPHQKVIVFTCNWCSYGGADMAGTSRMKYSPQTRIIRLPCSGRVDPSFVLRALEMGAGGVLITGCHPGECHYQDGNLKALRRYKLLKTILCQMGVEEGRVRLEWVSAAEGEKFTQLVNDFVALAIG